MQAWCQSSLHASSQKQAETAEESLDETAKAEVLCRFYLFLVLLCSFQFIIFCLWK